jgi:mannose-6-phosphate isomerase-like protein (cupin superfamily)
MKAAFLFVAVLATSAFAADAPILTRANDLQWVEVPSPAGARHADLWEGTTFVRWPFSTKVPSATLTQDLHIVVLAGTVTFDIEGRHTEIGPGGRAIIPKGTAHALGCESSGECTFLRQLK